MRLSLHLETVIFDLDGTLVDSARDILDTLKKCLLEEGLESEICLPLTPDLLGPPLEEIVDRVCPYLEPVKRNKLIQRYRAAYLECGFTKSRLYPDIAERLENLRLAGVRIFLATNKPGDASKVMLEKLDILKFFEYTAHSDSIPEKRLNKIEMLEMLINRHSLHAPYTIMVGDGVGDILSAKYHSFHSMAVFYGYGKRQELLAAEPELCLPTPDWRSGYYLRTGKPL